MSCFVGGPVQNKTSLWTRNVQTIYYHAKYRGEQEDAKMTREAISDGVHGQRGLAAIDEPALALHTEHAFDVRINFDKRWVFGPISGDVKQGYTSVGAGSTVRGPLLTGRVVDFSGADWAVVRGDGVVELNAHYMIEADDGTRIYIRNLGYVHGPLRAAEQASGEPPVIPGYFRCTPYFRAPRGPHDWLNRTVIVGVGQRRPKQTPEDDPDHSLFRYYVVR
jgi:hypothetical protein